MARIMDLCGKTAEANKRPPPSEEGIAQWMHLQPGGKDATRPFEIGTLQALNMEVLTWEERNYVREALVFPRQENRSFRFLPAFEPVKQ